MGFAAGFAAGWGAVDSAQRMKMDAERQKRDDEFRRSEQDMRKAEHADRMEERTRAKTIRQGVADAAAEPTTGQSVGTNFAAGPDDQRFLREQAASEAEMTGTAAPAQMAAATSGNQVKKFANEGQAANFAADRQGEVGYTKRVADVYRKSGEEGKARELDAEFKRLSKEGYKEALDYGFKTGDWAGSGEQFNKIGGSRLPEGTTLKGTPVERVTPEGVKVQDTNLQIVDAEGNVVRDLGSALQMRWAAEGFTQYQQHQAGLRGESRQERQVGVAEKNAKTQEDRLVLEDKKIAIQQQLADARERRDEAQMKYWAGQLDATNRRIDIAASRAAAGGGSGKADGAPGVSRDDEKHIATIVGAMPLPKGADPTAIVDTAARIKALAPGISASEAATVAATPGARIRQVQTNKGVFDALEVPAREVVGKDGKKSMTPAGVYLMTPGARRIDVPAPPAAPAPPKLTAAEIAAMDAEKRAADAQAAQIAQQEAAAARAAATAAFARPR